MDSEKIGIEIQRGNAGAFKLFFDSFYPNLFLFAKKYLKYEDSSRDIVQDAFLYYWNKRDEIHSLDYAKLYLYKYVKNRCLNYLRDRKKIDSRDLSQLDAVMFYHHVIVEETYEIIYQAIKKLSPRGQRVIELSLDGFKNEKIARELGISLNTVKTIKLRAFEALRKKLNGATLVAFYALIRAN